ncbi:MAG TPA: type II toxin-antitoxin system HigB family toxin [Bryobacteraceae bacterium]|nr:type II toxin-antitoxin system HigB family toxin [Bryobacteraceae bacterium]
MNVISRRGLLGMLKGKSKGVSEECIRWYKVARAAEWKRLEDVRVQYRDTDQIGRVLVFNIRSNRYRLIVSEAFEQQRLYIKALLTHKEYEREEWKKWK